VIIEAGKYNPTLKLCLSISKVLNKSFDELFWIGDNKDYVIYNSHTLPIAHITTLIGTKSQQAAYNG